MVFWDGVEKHLGAGIGGDRYFEFEQAQTQCVEGLAERSVEVFRRKKAIIWRRKGQNPLVSCPNLSHHTDPSQGSQPCPPLLLQVNLEYIP